MPNSLSDFYNKMAAVGGQLRAQYAFVVSYDFKPLPPVNATQFSDALMYTLQDMAFPDVGLGGGTSSGFDSTVDVSTFLGCFRTPGQTGMKAKNDEVVFNYLDMDICLHEKFFIPWLEVVAGTGPGGNSWTGSAPFIRADITVKVYSAASLAGVLNDTDSIVDYLIYGAYPVGIDSPKFKYGPDSATPTRGVAFEFNNVLVNRKK